MNQQTNGRKCYNCLRYSAYYTKQITFFDKLDYGRCSFNNELLQNKHGSCERWQAKSKPRLRQVKAASAALCKAAESICIIQQILSEDQKKD